MIAHSHRRRRQPSPAEQFARDVLEAFDEEPAEQEAMLAEELDRLGDSPDGDDEI